MSNVNIQNEDDDMVIVDDDSGTIGSGPIGRWIGKQISGGVGGTSGASGGQAGGNGVSSGNPVGGTAAGTSASGTRQQASAGAATNNNWPFGSAPANQPSISWNNANLAAPKKYTKNKVRYVIVATDNSTLELKELDAITPEEMIGISKFISLVSTYTILILGQSVIDYNFNINWTEMINNLGISQHFAPGLAPEDYDNDASDVLDILLYDGQ
jgi:hypothetical protein